MTQGTMQTKAHSKFNMPELRRRAKKLMRKKYKKTIKLSDVDKIWAEYCRYALVKPLIKNGEANIDECTKIEIVGKRIIDNPQAFGLMSKGLMFSRNGLVKPVGRLSRLRGDVIYKIKLTDSTFKGGRIIYRPDRKLSKAVSDSLNETSKYYRIES